MKRSLLFLISAISLATLTLPAQAANYRSTNGTTIVDLNEIGSSDLTDLPRNVGYYHTWVGGKQVHGNIEILTRNVASNNAKYTGTFDDYEGDAKTSCKGTIALDRTILAGGGVTLRAEWTIGQGGKNCSSPVGTKSVTNLVENLPIAKNGNYPDQPLNNPFSAESSAWGHPVWKVIDPTSLNCRATPGGRIVKSYPFGTRLFSHDRGVNVFGTDAAGQRWLRVPESRCFVRHSPTYIRPVSLPY